MRAFALWAVWATKSVVVESRMSLYVMLLVAMQDGVGEWQVFGCMSAIVALPVAMLP